MLSFTKCHATHLKYIDPITVQTDDAAILLSPEAADVINSTVAVSAWLGARCVGAAGIIEIWPGRATAWALLSKQAAPYMLQATRQVRSVLEMHKTNRIEATVLCDYEMGHKWIRLLGFELEATRMKSYYPNGADVSLYARVRK